MIYNMHDIARKAGEYICEEFKANPRLRFTNTSYGERGHILGSLACSDNDGEVTIVFTAIHHKGDDKKHANDIIKITETTQYEKRDKYDRVIREYSYETKEEVLMTFYSLTRHFCWDDETFTDDPAEAEAAAAKRTERWYMHAETERLNDERRQSRELDITDPERREYYKHFIYEQVQHKLKKDARIFIYRSSYSRHEQPHLVVGYEYRGQKYLLKKRQAVDRAIFAERTAW